MRLIFNGKGQEIEPEEKEVSTYVVAMSRKDGRCRTKWKQ